MIHGATIFSTADLTDFSGYLFAKIKIRGIEYKCEILRDNSIFEGNNNTSEILRLKKNGETEYETVKTSKLYDWEHSKNRQW